MLVIPLGLGTKLRRAPLVTALMACVWIYAYLVDRSSDPIVAGIVSSVAASGLRDNARQLFVDYCLSRKGTKERCERYSVLVWTGYPGKAPPRTRRAVSDAAMNLLATERAKAAKVREELDGCATSANCFIYRDIIWRFLDTYRVPQKRFAELASYKPFKSSYVEYRKRLKQLCERYECLVSSHVTPASIGWAQLRHGSLLHLASNLFVFLIFGIYVEQRASRLVYLLTMAIGGSIGLALHAYYFSSGDTLTLGGSANVSAVLGMFFVIFLHQKMRFLVWLPRKIYWGTSFFAPVKYTFPLMFMLSDVTGSLESGFTSLAPERVAHLAHLGGLAFGLLIGWLIVGFSRLPKPFIYDDEPADMRRLGASQDIYQILQLGEAMIARNPECVPAMLVTCRSLLMWMGTGRVVEHAALRARGRMFLAENMQTVCAVYVRQGDYSTPLALLSLVPPALPFRHCLGKLGPLHVLQLGDVALARGDTAVAMRLYEFYLQKYPRSRKCAEVTRTGRALLAQIHADHAVASVNGYAEVRHGR